MLRVRLIPTLTLKNGRVIKTINFDRFRDVGDPRTMGKVYDSQDVDELILLDITASQEKREPDWVSLQKVADECAMPLTMGGGVSSVEHIRKMLQIGADKVSINSAAVNDISVLSRGAKVFGSQCIVASIDAMRNEDKSLSVMVNGGADAIGLDPVAHAKAAEDAGAGEILLTAIHREGTMMGFDVELVRAISEVVSIPVVANGGAGLLLDLVDVVRNGGASAVACASIFNFTDNKPIKARAFMQQHGIHVRPT